jgi:hypothetical protein
MKQLFFSMRKGMAATACILLAAVLFSACRKSNDSVNNNTQVAGLMTFNLVADKPGILVTLSGNSLTTSPLPFNGYSGGYVNIYPGTRSIQAYDYSNTNTALSNSSGTFDANKYYSLFVVGANNVYSNVVALDNFDSLSATNGKAYVRFINAIPDSSNPRVTLTAGGTNVSEANAHYTTVSQFTAVTPGQLTVNISNDGNINANRTIAVDQQKTYTILLTGKPGSTDSATAVKIKFVENGRLTP